MRRCFCCLGSGLLLVLGIASAGAAELQPLLAAIRGAGEQSKGQAEAQRAWAKLVQADVSTLPEILAGMDQAGPLADNWIATVVEAIVERSTRQGGHLPVAALERFATAADHAPRARRLAYELAISADPSAQQRLLRKMIDDPSLELRRDAIAALIEEAQRLQKSDAAAAKKLYGQAFAAARDHDQVQQLAGRLWKLGEKPDVAAHFGFPLSWHVIGPFDNHAGKGYAAVYPPEKAIDFAASYPGKNGTVKWIPWTVTQKDDNQVDMNKSLGEQKGVVGYAVTEFWSSQRQKVQFRLGALTALKLWLNGKLIDQHEVYFLGTDFDQYVVPVTLESGKNVILVKLCQNEVVQPWTKNWRFQFRVCDALGTGILSSDRKKP